MKLSPRHPALRVSSGKAVTLPGFPAFTLIELLLVMVVISILMSIAAPAVSSMMRGSKLTQSGQLVSDQFGYARQTALSKGRPVEVRFYRFVDLDAQENPPGKYRALQLFEVLEDGTYVPLTRVFTFAGSSIIMDSGSTLSTLIGNASGTSTPPTRSTGSALKYEIPRVGLNYEAAAFRFQPDGSTNLTRQSASTQWCVTLHDVSKGDNLTTPPPNFVTLQIKSLNGKVKIWRP